jgi:hypothetical protein
MMGSKQFLGFSHANVFQRALRSTHSNQVGLHIVELVFRSAGTLANWKDLSRPTCK